MLNISIIRRGHLRSQRNQSYWKHQKGPNCFLLMEKQSLPLVSSLIKTCFLADQNIRNGISEEVSIPEEFSELQKTFIDYKGEVEYAIQTSIGSGSKVVVPPFQV